MNKFRMMIAIFAITAVAVFTSCEDSAKNSGIGGPDTSPDEYTDLTTPADDTTNTELTGTTSSGEGVVVETSSETNIEGSLDTSTGDTGLTDADEVLDGTAYGDETASGGTGSQGSSDSSGSGSTGSQGSSDNSGSGSTGSQGSSDNSGSGSTGSDEVIDTIATGEPLSTGDVVNALENDEAASQSGVDYTVDTSKGRWYEEVEKELTGETDLNNAESRINVLRAEIKAILLAYKNGTTDKNSARSRIRQIREEIASLRNRIGNGGRLQKGIYTNWANENLYLNINKAESGWYRLVIVAKNRGKLPEGYDRFTFNITSNDESVAGISVKASDSVYYSGSADFELKNPAGTKLNILWTNDAYMKDKYDANVNIKKIALIRLKDPKDKKVNVQHLNGDEFSFTDGRWFFDKKAAYTHWSDQVIGYTFNNLEEGEYEVTITAKNYGDLPLEKNYKAFSVEIDSDYDSASMSIKADDKNWNSETVKMNFGEGENTIFITWTNDSYKEGSYDSNIMIKTIGIKKVHKSSLTAFLLRTKPGNKFFILGAFIIIAGLVFGIYMKNRRNSEVI